MKILGLVASPRKMGNSEILVKSMLSSLPEPVEKEMIRLTDLAIAPCRACYACLSADKYCAIPDDLGFLLAKIKQADGVIIASPCYFLGSHTIVKQIGDRLISLLAKSSEFPHKPCITAIAYGIPGWDGYAPEAVNNFARFLHLDVAGTIIVQAASPGEVIRPEVISEAKSLAQKLLHPVPMTTANDSDHLLCPVCRSRLLEISRKREVRCVMCGMTGTLLTEGGEIKIACDPQEHSRFSAEGLSQHSDLLAKIKSEYILQRKELAIRRKEYNDDSWWITTDSPIK